MEFMNNEVSVCADLNGVNLVEFKPSEDWENYLSIEFENDPEIQLYMTEKDLDYFLERCIEIAKIRKEKKEKKEVKEDVRQ